MSRNAPAPIVGLVLALILGGCAASTATAPPSAPAAPSAGSSPAASADPWAEDLATLDRQVRLLHPNPFKIHPESEWNAKLAELRQTLPTASPDEQIVQVAGLVGLLDTHSGFTAAFHQYGVLLYPFADGWFVIAADDRSLIGSRLVAIGSTPVAQVEAALRPLVPADNESGKLDGLQFPMSSVEYLHGLGIVKDPAKPGYVLERPDGSTPMVDPAAVDEVVWEGQLGIIGDLMGTAPEAVARRAQSAWTRLDKPTKTFIISYNDYTESGLTQPLAALKTALDSGAANRVVLDMRYLRGGNGSLADPLIAALSGDERINRPGGLVVMTGRENVSAGTVVAAALDAKTKATFVGEMTPARADNFLCDCSDIALPNSGFTVTVPTFTLNTGDPRDAVAPNIPFALTAADFFAGKDPLLAAVLAGDLASPAP
ncbi:MAG TPA: hypothetical protein VLR93_01655 [Patescibacteria group bacterium]|nr:hypothetical protein [Patescibacteria group bacterium]